MYSHGPPSSARKLSYLCVFGSPLKKFRLVSSDIVTISAATSCFASRYRKFRQKTGGCFPLSKANSNSDHKHRLVTGASAYSFGFPRNCHCLRPLSSIYNFSSSARFSFSNSNLHFCSLWLLMPDQTFQFGEFQDLSRIGINSN